MLEKPKKLNMEIAAVSAEGYSWWKKCCEVWEKYHNKQLAEKDDLINGLEQILKDQKKEYQEYQEEAVKDVVAEKDAEIKANKHYCDVCHNSCWTPMSLEEKSKVNTVLINDKGHGEFKFECSYCRLKKQLDTYKAENKKLKEKLND